MGCKDYRIVDSKAFVYLYKNQNHILKMAISIISKMHCAYILRFISYSQYFKLNAILLHENPSKRQIIFVF